MIKLFEQYNEYSQVKSWLDMMKIRNYTINDDLTVDVNGIVELDNKGLTEIPIQFGKVNGRFDCYSNKLTTLKGCPIEVNDIFDVDKNNLTNLIGSPRTIGGYFSCQLNKLTSLEGCPEYIGGRFYIEFNNITTLKYTPNHIEVGINCEGNPLPKEISDFCTYRVNSIILFKYQDDYGIWNTDGSFNNGRWVLFHKDYEKGLLKND